jgi:trk/ktr system potassium uptake protein
MQFAIKSFISGDGKEYIRNNKLEYYILLGLVTSMFINWLMGFSISYWLLSFTGIQETNHLYILFLHIWVLIIVAIELGKVATKPTIWKLSPPWLFIMSFVVLIVIGSSLFMLPEMTTSGNGMKFSDALFTSVSANCVTGLTIVDVSTFFTLKGKILLLVLIQLGGLNIISFATFFISKYHKVITSNRQDRTVKEVLHTESLEGSATKKMLRKIISTTLIIEFIGVLVMYNFWGESVSLTPNFNKVFYSIFHSVSAFNNAGFSLFSNGLTNNAINTNYSIHIIIAVLIILGGLGFTTLWDLTKLKTIFSNKNEKSPFRTSSIVALSTSLVLIVIGGLFFVWQEEASTFENHSEYGMYITGFFQSITARTAGFNTTNIGSLSIPVVVMLIIWMFIGASSGSTGGGIKTSTLFVLIAAMWNKLQGKSKELDLLFRDLIKKAIAILSYSLLVLAIGVGILLITEKDQEFVELLFEAVSAFGTVGLSTGITSELSMTGKIVIMILMFIGRIGPLALAYTLIKGMDIQSETPKGIMIG